MSWAKPVKSRTSMAVPDSGCCQGHACDDCKTCRSGRCCRRDNPDYRLPKVGDWDGPVYGEIGVKNVVGDTVECHACGRFLLAIGIHSWRKHDLSTMEYKAVFGLPSRRSLVGPATAARHGEVARENIRRGRMKLISTNPGEGLFAEMTTEQRSGLSTRYLHRFDDGEFCLTASEARSLAGVSQDELDLYAKHGEIQFKRTPAGRLFSRSSVQRIKTESVGIPPLAASAEDVDLSRWQTIHNAALVLGVGQAFAGKLVKRGHLRLRRECGRVLIDPADLRRLIDQRVRGVGVQGHGIRSRRQGLVPGRLAS